MNENALLIVRRLDPGHRRETNAARATLGAPQEAVAKKPDI
jgi:hypothetical protein